MQDYYLHIGKSYYFDGDRFVEEALCCIHESIDEVIMYMSQVRNYPIMDLTNPDYDTLAVVISGADATRTLAVVGEITLYQFADESQKDEWLQQDNRDMYYLVPHEGIIDHRITGMSQKVAKRVMVPRVVEECILSEDEKFKAELVLTSHTLKELALFLNDRKLFADYTRKTLDVIGIIENVLKGDTDLTDGYASRHPVLFCGEPEYRSIIRSHIEYENMKNEYRTMVDLDYT